MNQFAAKYPVPWINGAERRAYADAWLRTRDNLSRMGGFTADIVFYAHAAGMEAISGCWQKYQTINDGRVRPEHAVMQEGTEAISGCRKPVSTDERVALLEQGIKNRDEAIRRL
jgi:hypothetical protein